MIQPPFWLRAFFPGVSWRKNKQEKVVYLTFDDGPVEPETIWVIEELRKHQIPATFFCVGENAHKNPHLINQLIDEGHSVGNHTYNHIPAWKCSRSEYFENIDKAMPHIKSRLFRPPHGKLYPWYVPKLRKQFSEIVMWDVLSKDFDNRLSAQDVIDNTLNHVRNGSIIVFHDSNKAWDRMHIALPACIKALKDQGYQFRKIKM